MISSIKVYEDFANIGGEREKIGETKEVRLLNKLDVIEKFMKHFGGYEIDNKQKKSELPPSSIKVSIVQAKEDDE